MATTSSTTTIRPTRTKRWAIPAGALALTAAVLGVVALATPASADDPGTGSHIMECQSGIVTSGDVQMSAASATRVSSADIGTIPADCTLR